ncbi:hypothetical protein B0T18DRAFT_419841, partial [Schizothecium vesticola]
MCGWESEITWNRPKYSKQDAKAYPRSVANLNALDCRRTMPLQLPRPNQTRWVSMPRHPSMHRIL